jgi:hypothetical protein
MLREDKRAHIEKQLESKAPIYGLLPPAKSKWESIERALSFQKNTVIGWKETYSYELSSGKPLTPTARARTYMAVHFTQAEFDQFAEAQLSAPVLVTTWEGKHWWWYLNRFWWDSEGLAPADVQALVLQRDKKKQVTLERARADAFGSAAPDDQHGARRPGIPESVRHEVWRRDQGRCVDCGSRENLEFDHIIPFSKGGSNTARNLELRCEQCNRRKGASI